MKFVTSPTGNISARYKDAKGKWRNTNLRTKNKKEAIQVAKSLNIEELEDAGKLGVLSREVVAKIVSGKDVKFKTVVAEWLKYKGMLAGSGNSMNTQSSILMQFMRDYGYKNAGISGISEEDIFDFLNRPDDTSLSNRKLRRSTLSALYKFAVARAYVVFNPVQDVRVDLGNLSHSQKESKERKPFSKKEFDQIFKHAPYFYRQAAGLSWWTGLRLGDIASLEWDSINKDSIVVWTEKRDKKVELPLDHEFFGGGAVRQIINEIILESNVYCFPDQQADHADPKKRAKFSVYFSRILYRGNDCILPDTPKEDRKSFHCFRHSFVSRLKRSGVKIEEISKAVGHSNTATTLGYSH